MLRAIFCATCIAILAATAAPAQTPPDHDDPQPATTNGNPASGGIVIFPPYTPPATELNPPGANWNFPTFSIPRATFPYNVP